MDTIDPMGTSYNLTQPESSNDATLPEMELERTLPRQVSTGVSRGVQQLGTPNIYVDSGSNQIIVSKTDNQVTTNQVLMGNQPTFGEGFFVTKPGIDVAQANSTEDFVFNSNQNVFKIVKSGTLRSPALSLSDPGVGVFDTTAAASSVPHDLGYIPAIISYVFQPGQTYEPMPFNSSNGAGNAARWYTMTSVVSVVEVYFRIEALVFHQSFSIAEGDFTMKYYLLQETAN